MATPNFRLIEALRKTAQKLENNVPYQWGNMGSCNCGNLAQELTNYTKAQIHEYALQSRSGDWSEQTDAYCPASKLPLDWVIDAMLDAGLTQTDLKNLERLSDQKILRRFPYNDRFLKHNLRKDVIRYLHAWADLMEEELLTNIDLDAIQHVDLTESLV